MITDSLKFSKKLLNAGFTHQQVEVLQDVINDNLENLVTKKNMDYLVIDLKRDAKSNDNEIKYRIDSKVQDMQFTLQKEISAAENKTFNVKFKLDMCIMVAALIAWMLFLILILK